jgi:hypothetical protein
MSGPSSPCLSGRGRHGGDAPEQHCIWFRKDPRLERRNPLKRRGFVDVVDLHLILAIAHAIQEINAILVNVYFNTAVGAARCVPTVNRQLNFLVGPDPFSHAVNVEGLRAADRAGTSLRVDSAGWGLPSPQTLQDSRWPQVSPISN